MTIRERWTLLHAHRERIANWLALLVLLSLGFVWLPA